MHLRHFIAFITSTLLSFSASAENYSLDDLSWLEGQWLDTREPDRRIEVQWNGTIGDAMIGTWRRMDGETLYAYEILTMRQRDGDIFYRFDLFQEDENGLFVATDPLRLRLLDAKENHARFEIVDEENWILTMVVEDDFLKGWMDDMLNPSPEKRYNYFAKRQ